MKVPMVDLQAQHRALRGEIESAIAGVFDSCAFVQGPNVRAFEQEAAAYLGVRHAIGCASGTDALHLALRAAGVGPGHEVITTPFSFVATAEAITYTGARPVFVDIDPHTFTLDPEAVAAAVGPRTVAVLPVHLYGQAAALGPLQELCAARGLRLIEDCAQAFGATWRGRKLGGLGDLGCFSFYPSKNLGACGDGGLVTTQDDALAARVRLLREHGHEGGYRHAVIGYNSRLDELQAAILRVKLRHIDALNEARRRVADLYTAWLWGVDVVTPFVSGEGAHVYHQYTLRSSQRDALRSTLNAAGIGNNVYYPIPLHHQPSFQSYGPVASLPHVELAAEQVISLPMFPELSTAQAERVVSAVRGALGG